MIIRDGLSRDSVSRPRPLLLGAERAQIGHGWEMRAASHYE